VVTGGVHRHSTVYNPVRMPLTLNRSQQLQQRAAKVIPGGVSSPVRAFKAVGGDAPFIVKASAAYLWDADGNRYIDYVGSWGPMILGHAFPAVVQAAQRTAENGTSFGASTPLEIGLAELIIKAVPSIEKVRFVNSGTEAAMSALRLARAYTGRKYIIKFEGCYHGHSDSLLVKAGSGVATLGIPGSAGVPDEYAKLTLALPFNDLDAMRAAFKQRPDSIAGVIVEPVVGNMGCVLPKAGYLEGLRESTRHHGALLIFDEVMTGFRVAFGGAQSLYNVTPDITCLGKIIGGGFPVGAYGASGKIMETVAPLGPMYQAGTLSGNPVAMAAGVATLQHLVEHPRIYAELESSSSKLATGAAAAARETGVPLTINRIGSMMTFFFTRENVSDWKSAEHSDTARFGRFHRNMLEAGIYLPPSQFEAMFVSAAHTADDIAATIDAGRAALKRL
jgi:glutamate-1-semialdehyde 2,1-aminomutase